MTQHVPDLARQVCQRCWAKGSLAVFLVGNAVHFKPVNDADVRDQRFVGVFDKACGNREVEAAIRYTARSLEQVRQ